MHKKLKQFIQVILFAGIGLAILIWVFQRQQEKFSLQCALDGIAYEDCSLFDKIMADFSSVNVWIIAVVIIFFMISNVSRAIRWQMLLEPIEHKPRFLNTIGTIMLGYFANLGFPRSGEVIKAAALSRYEGFAFEKVMGTVVTDRILDLFCLLAIITFAFFLEFDTVKDWIFANLNLPGAGEILNSSWFRIGIFLAIVTLIIGIFIFRRAGDHKLIKKIKEIIIGFMAGLTSVARVRKPFWFIFHSLNIWLMYFLMTYVCFFAFEPTADLGWRASLMVFVFGSLGVVFPSPGGMGTFHFLATTALEIYGVASGDAFSMANILYFSLQVFGNILFGLLSILMLSILNKPKDQGLL